jgi:hypothetical protein
MSDRLCYSSPKNQLSAASNKKTNKKFPACLNQSRRLRGKKTKDCTKNQLPNNKKSSKAIKGIVGKVKLKQIGFCFLNYLFLRAIACIERTSFPNFAKSDEGDRLFTVLRRQRQCRFDKFRHWQY